MAHFQFHRASRRNDSRTAMLETDVGRAEILDDLLGHLREEDFKRNLLYSLLDAHRPEIVIDCVNTATGIAYRDVYTASDHVWDELIDSNLDDETVVDCGHGPDTTIGEERRTNPFLLDLR